MVFNYEEVKLRGTKNCKCKKCRKKLRRQKTFSQTINPWNKTATGTVKTRDEILKSLRDEIREWKEKDEICENCSN